MAEISSIIQHASLTGSNIHVPYAGTYATESARLAAALDQSMEGKLFRQLSDNTLWMFISAANNTWIPLGKATAKSLGRNGDDDIPMTFYWAGQEGQPGWLWGGNDGTNMYIYNPANFSVNYANSANSANSANYANSAGSAGTAGNTTSLGGTIGYGSGFYEYPHRPKFYAPQGGQWIILYNNFMEIPHPNGMGDIASFALTAGTIYTGGALIHEGASSGARGSSSAETGVFFRIG